jgi:hypothetical protein
MRTVHPRRILERRYHPDEDPLDHGLALWADCGVVSEDPWRSQPVDVNGRELLASARAFGQRWSAAAEVATMHTPHGLLIPAP